MSCLSSSGNHRLHAALLVAGWLAGSPLAADAQERARETDPRVAEATLPLPVDMRAGAGVIAREGDRWMTLREGTGSFTCVADEPGDERFHVACYHVALEAYMARGRELRAEGLDTRASIARRWEEIEAGTLAMPSASLFQLVAEDGWSGDPADARSLTVLYVPYATAEELGLPTRPVGRLPWLMFPGKPTAHVMISG